MEIKLLKDIKGGPYVEFNISGGEDYIHWSESSYFLDESIYGMFYECFDRVSHSFNYYGPTMFVGEKLQELKRELEINSLYLAEIKSLFQLLKYLKRNNSGTNLLTEMDEESSDWRNNYQDVINNLRNVNNGLASIIRRCISEKRVLWVLGI
jgi:hypothetical protein